MSLSRSTYPRIIRGRVCTVAVYPGRAPGRTASIDAIGAHEWSRLTAWGVKWWWPTQAIWMTDWCDQLVHRPMQCKVYKEKLCSPSTMKRLRPPR